MPNSWMLFSSAWTSSNFIEFEFHWAGKLGIQTNNEFTENEFFEFKIDFPDEFAKLWFEFFVYFKFYQVWISQKHKQRNSNINQVWNFSRHACRVFEFQVAFSITGVFY